MRGSKFPDKFEAGELERISKISSKDGAMYRSQNPMVRTVRRGGLIEHLKPFDDDYRSRRQKIFDLLTGAGYLLANFLMTCSTLWKSWKRRIRRALALNRVES